MYNQQAVEVWRLDENTLLELSPDGLDLRVVNPGGQATIALKVFGTGVWVCLPMTAR
jgi:hypothetical protein